MVNLARISSIFNLINCHSFIKWSRLPDGHLVQIPHGAVETTTIGNTHPTLVGTQSNSSPYWAIRLSSNIYDLFRYEKLGFTDNGRSKIKYSETYNQYITKSQRESFQVITEQQFELGFSK